MKPGRARAPPPPRATLCSRERRRLLPLAAAALLPLSGGGGGGTLPLASERFVGHPRRAQREEQQRDALSGLVGHPPPRRVADLVRVRDRVRVCPNANPDPNPNPPNPSPNHCDGSRTSPNSFEQG